MKKIMFSDRFGLTQAVLDGRKTMTRRMIKAPKKMEGKDVYGFAVAKRPGSNEWIEVMALDEDEGMINNILPKYKPGEVVAVAQSYKEVYWREPYVFPDFTAESPGWRNKMFVASDFMPHQIRITNVKVERLQDISDKGCVKEGIYVSETEPFVPNGYSPNCANDPKEPKKWFHTPREAFAALIDKVSGKGTWESNPWVFVYEFELVK